MASKVPSVTFHNGVVSPIFGLGTATDLNNPDVDLLNKAFDAAIESGYRLFDTAAAYKNETILGDFLEKKFKEGKIKRNEVFITTKLHIVDFQPENAEKAIKSSLEKLKTDYIDLYLLHGPTPVKEENGKLVPDLIPHIETWKVLEKYYKSGTLKSIGLSNFTIPQIEDLISKAEIKPHNLQVEAHVLFPQYELHEFCKKHNISFTSFATFGSPTRHQYDPNGKWGQAEPLELPIVKELAKKYGKTPGQVLLRQMIQRGIIVIPRSTNPKRIAENIDVFDFELTEGEMKQFEDLKTYERNFTWDFVAGHPWHFVDEFRGQA